MYPHKYSPSTYSFHSVIRSDILSAPNPYLFTVKIYYRCHSVLSVQVTERHCTCMPVHGVPTHYSLTTSTRMLITDFEFPPQSKDNALCLWIRLCSNYGTRTACVQRCTTSTRCSQSCACSHRLNFLRQQSLQASTNRNLSEIQCLILKILSSSSCHGNSHLIPSMPHWQLRRVGHDVHFEKNCFH